MSASERDFWFFYFYLFIFSLRLAAIALLYLDQEDAFWCLVAIVEVFMPRDYYTKTLLGSQVPFQDCSLTHSHEKFPKNSGKVVKLEQRWGFKHVLVCWIWLMSSRLTARLFYFFVICHSDSGKILTYLLSKLYRILALYNMNTVKFSITSHTIRYGVTCKLLFSWNHVIGMLLFTKYTILYSFY